MMTHSHQQCKCIIISYGVDFNKLKPEFTISRTSNRGLQRASLPIQGLEEKKVTVEIWLLGTDLFNEPNQKSGRTLTIKGTSNEDKAAEALQSVSRIFKAKDLPFVATPLVVYNAEFTFRMGFPIAMNQLEENLPFPVHYNPELDCMAEVVLPSYMINDEADEAKMRIGSRGGLQLQKIKTFATALEVVELLKPFIILSKK